MTPSSVQSLRASGSPAVERSAIATLRPVPNKPVVPTRRVPGAGRARPEIDRSGPIDSRSKLKNPTVLLVEDSQTDAVLLRHALETDVEHPCRVELVSSGADALEYLEKRGAHESAPTPDLIVLDVRLPDMDGTELLERIRRKRRYRFLPVVVLSGAANIDAIRRTCGIWASSFVSKPLDAEGFAAVGRHIRRFWLDRSVPPAS